jgi:steroid delta-isomerase-like uncharacterized protein
MDTKTLARNFYAALTDGRFEAIDDLVAEHFIEHEAVPTDADGREGLREFFMMAHASFSDFAMNVEDMGAEGDKVLVRATMQGIQRAEFLGIPSRQADARAGGRCAALRTCGRSSSTGA